MAGSAHEVVHVVWAEVDPQEETCSREPGIGSVLTRMYNFVVSSLMPFFFPGLFLYQRLVCNLYDGPCSQGLWQPELCLEDGV